MVTIVPPGTQSSMAGANLGSGFSKQVGEMMPTLFERDLVQKGLQQIQDMTPEQIQDMQKNPFGAMAQILSPFAGTRQGAQFADPVLNYAMKMMETGQKGSPEAIKALEGVDKFSEPGVMTPQEERMKIPKEDKLLSTRERGVQAIKKGLGEQYFPMYEQPESKEGKETFRPQKPIEAPRPFTAKDKAKSRNLLSQYGIKDKSAQDSILQDVEKERQDLYAAAKEGYKNISEYQQSRIAEDNRFFKQAEPLLSQNYGQLSPSQSNIWKGISRLSENAGSDEDRLRNTTQMFDQLYYQPVTSFRNLAPSLPTASLFRPGTVQDYLNDSRGLIQDHIKSIKEREDIPDQLKSEMVNSLRDEYMTSMAEKDWGTAQSAYAVSNISPDWGKSLPEAKRKSEGMKGVSPYVEPDFVDRNKAVNDLTNSLMKLGPEDSIILAREKAIGKNYDERIFNEAFNKAVLQGFSLSDYQRMERPRLSVAQRLTLDDIMRGKRDLSEMFKAKK